MLDVLLCIESRIYREGLRVLLRNQREFGEIGVCSGLKQLGEALASSPRALVVIDVALGAGANSATDAISEAFRLAHGQPVIALGLEESDDEVLALIEAGAAAFVTKNDFLDDLIVTIDTVARGEMHCAPKSCG